MANIIQHFMSFMGQPDPFRNLLDRVSETLKYVFNCSEANIYLCFFKINSTVKLLLKVEFWVGALMQTEILAHLISLEQKEQYKININKVSHIEQYS